MSGSQSTIDNRQSQRPLDNNTIWGLDDSDMPALEPAVLRLLVDRLVAEPALAAMTLAAPRPAPLPAAVRPDAVRDAVDAILASGGRRSLLAAIGIVRSATLAAEEWRALDPEGDTLRDIDTPADLPQP